MKNDCVYFHKVKTRLQGYGAWILGQVTGVQVTGQHFRAASLEHFSGIFKLQALIWTRLIKLSIDFIDLQNSS